MFSGQRRSLSVAEESNVQNAASEIISLSSARGNAIVAIAPLNTMAIFLCGTVVTSKSKRQHILNVLQTMDHGTSGRALQKMIKALESLYIKYDSVDDAKDIDWWVYLQQEGLLGFSLCGI